MDIEWRLGEESSKNISNDIRQFSKGIKKGGEGYLSDIRD